MIKGRCYKVLTDNVKYVKYHRGTIERTLSSGDVIFIKDELEFEYIFGSVNCKGMKPNTLMIVKKSNIDKLSDITDLKVIKNCQQ